MGTGFVFLIIGTVIYILFRKNQQAQKQTLAMILMSLSAVFTVCGLLTVLGSLNAGGSVVIAIVGIGILAGAAYLFSRRSQPLVTPPVEQGAAPAPTDFTPHMPEVEPIPEGFVEWARQKAADPESRQVVIISPGRVVRTSEALPPRETLPAEVVAEAEAIAPSTEPWQIVAIGLTDPQAFEADPYQAVPFLGSLEVLVQIGHAVILFEGHPEAFIQLCREADLLIVDSQMIPFLQPDWLEVARPVMRRPNVLKINRRGREVLGVEKVSWQL